MQLIDTHVHLNFSVFQEDLAALRSHWQAAGVVKLIHSCVEPSEFAGIAAIADQFPEVSFAVGLHPLDADKWQPEMAAEILEKASSDPRVVAIGEIGLDFFKADNQVWQHQVLQAQLEIASKLQKPIIVHCRDAAPALREVLEKFQQTHRTPNQITGVMHCWGGTPEETQWFLDLGFYISFSGIVTFKNAHQVHASAQMVPSDRLLIETDCPFLAPVPQRGKRNEPAYVLHVAEAVAKLRGVELEVLAKETTANACRLFQLLSLHDI